MKTQTYFYKHDTWHVIPDINITIEKFGTKIAVGFGLNFLNRSTAIEFYFDKNEK